MALPAAEQSHPNCLTISTLAAMVSNSAGRRDDEAVEAAAVPAPSGLPDPRTSRRGHRGSAATRGSPANDFGEATGGNPSHSDRRTIMVRVTRSGSISRITSQT